MNTSPIQITPKTARNPLKKTKCLLDLVEKDDEAVRNQLDGVQAWDNLEVQGQAGLRVVEEMTAEEILKKRRELY